MLVRRRPLPRRQRRERPPPAPRGRQRRRRRRDGRRQARRIHIPHLLHPPSLRPAPPCRLLHLPHLARRQRVPKPHDTAIRRPRARAPIQPRGRPERDGRRRRARVAPLAHRAHRARARERAARVDRRARRVVRREPHQHPLVLLVRLARVRVVLVHRRAPRVPDRRRRARAVRACVHVRVRARVPRVEVRRAGVERAVVVRLGEVAVEAEDGPVLVVLVVRARRGEDGWRERHAVHLLPAHLALERREPPHRRGVVHRAVEVVVPQRVRVHALVLGASRVRLCGSVRVRVCVSVCVCPRIRRDVHVHLHVHGRMQP
ncbi:hypothetical protein B0H17DRAFT_1055709 [Mycena rosella]|uniref:Uncharacterized protein n=1 Tax=Mycena rosella TaxID=1033263 RepID=A0AAD7GMZ2_MYCRO|nr:hypothetical protein B0H17DRAFT_1055709 [Mycena rosella]